MKIEFYNKEHQDGTIKLQIIFLFVSAAIYFHPSCAKCSANDPVYCRTAATATTNWRPATTDTDRHQLSFLPTKQCIGRGRGGDAFMAWQPNAVL